MSRVGGIIQFKVDGVQYAAKGNYTYNLGQPKREAVVGADAVHGYKETAQAAFIEGEITDARSVDLTGLTRVTNATVMLQLGSGKVISLRNAWFAGEGTGNTEEGNFPVRFEALSGEEIQ